MADDTTPDFTPETLTNGEDNSPAIGLISQYVKDLSFENPNAPAVYQWQAAPEMDVQFNIGARSEEHTSETPVTNAHLVCRLLLEKKKKQKPQQTRPQHNEHATKHQMKSDQHYT